jgi:diguanylate cyclase (GGDEF)-like protein
VFLEAEPLFLADPGENPLASPQLVEMANARSIMWQPILSHGGVIGVLCVCWSERVADVSARAARAVALLTDETAMALAHRDALQRLAVQATTDPLTGLPNRRAWDDLVEREMALAARRRHPLTLALLDMDRFKRFNDTRGHTAGDELLGEFAARARGVLREGDALARWGGEEFAVLLPDCPSHGFAASILDRIRAVVPAGQSCSVGYASWDGTESAEQLIERADRALYRAKAMGRDRAVCADATPSSETVHAPLERASPLGVPPERAPTSGS